MDIAVGVDKVCMASAICTNELFPWHEKFSVGIPEIDTQHKGLIRLINDLHAAMTTGQGKQAVGKILDDLVGYTQVHFRSEEDLLRQKKYSKLANHQGEHKKLTAQVVELQEKYRGGRLMLTVEVMQFLKNWLADHIMGHDHQYAAEFKSK